MPSKKKKKTIGEESERRGEEQAKRKSQNCYLNPKTTCTAIWKFCSLCMPDLRKLVWFWI